MSENCLKQKKTKNSRHCYVNIMFFKVEQQQQFSSKTDCVFCELLCVTQKPN